MCVSLPHQSVGMSPDNDYVKLTTIIITTSHYERIIAVIFEIISLLSMDS